MVTITDSELEIKTDGETEKEARRNYRIMAAEKKKAEKENARRRE